jgi:glutamate dehydrogenase
LSRRWDTPRIQRISNLTERGFAAHPEATRIRRSVEEIAASGLTLAKLTVAANLLGDLVKG